MIGVRESELLAFMGGWNEKIRDWRGLKNTAGFS
jgi:hypothetical protein